MWKVQEGHEFWNGPNDWNINVEIKENIVIIGQ